LRVLDELALVVGASVAHGEAHGVEAALDGLGV
jgi:hypothetical protein